MAGAVRRARWRSRKPTDRRRDIFARAACSSRSRHRQPSRLLPRRVAGPARVEPREQRLEPGNVHLVLPQLEVLRERLDRVELVPEPDLVHQVRYAVARGRDDRIEAGESRRLLVAEVGDRLEPHNRHRHAERDARDLIGMAKRATAISDSSPDSVSPY